MEDLTKIVGGVQAAEADAQATARRTKTTAAATLETAQRNIDIAFETTGDPLQDGIVVLYGADLVHYPQIVANYEETAEKLKGKSGEPVVLVSRWRERTGRIGRFIEPQYKISSSVSVAILTGEELEFDYDEKTCHLPTSRYASLRREHRSEVQLKEDALPVASKPFGFRSAFGDRFDLGYDLHEPVDQDRLSQLEVTMHHGETIETLTVAIGDDGIVEWLSEGTAPLNRMNPEFAAARDLCDALEIPKIAPVTDEQKRYLGMTAV